MSGLIALLDDVAGIAKIAAASVDDVTGMAAKAGAKAAGALIDDAAVTPKYVHGFNATRELPIIWKIAKGSIFNKVVVLLPIALALSSFAPWLIPQLLMLGGAYLCFEGAEKVYHLFVPHADAHGAASSPKLDPTRLEKQRVSGAIKTDFILSAEIMTIALSTIPSESGIWLKAFTLLVVAIGITAAVYGSVAVIVKADDVGLALARQKTGLLAIVGRAVVKAMPAVMNGLMIVGTAAMIWVGGNIIVHGLDQVGWPAPYNWIHHQAIAASAAFDQFAGAVAWIVTAFFDGLIGLAIGLLLIPLSKYVIGPVANATLVPMISGVKAFIARSRA